MSEVTDKRKAEKAEAAKVMRKQGPILAVCLVVLYLCYRYFSSH